MKNLVVSRTFHIRCCQFYLKLYYLELVLFYYYVLDFVVGGKHKGLCLKQCLTITILPIPSRVMYSNEEMK